MFATALREAPRQRLDERLRKDADDLLREHPCAWTPCPRRLKRGEEDSLREIQQTGP